MVGRGKSELQGSVGVGLSFLGIQQAFGGRGYSFPLGEKFPAPPQDGVWSAFERVWSAPVRGHV